MRKLKGKATILFSEGGLKVEIGDRLSGVVIRFTLDQDATCRAMSRQAYVDCEVQYPERLDLIGKKREVKRVLINKTWELFEKDPCPLIEAQCKKENIFVGGFELFDYGTRSQQNTKGKHQVILERYIEGKDNG